MSLARGAALARRELRGGLRGFRILIACLALGVAAIAAVGIVRAAIEAGLARDGAALLGGDAEIELTYRFADPEERAWMAGVAARVSEVAEFRSMAGVEGPEGPVTALAQVRAVDGAYPLLGAVKLQSELTLPQALAVRDGLPGAVMEGVLADRLGLAPGDAFRLGDTNLRYTARLTSMPDGTASGFALGPRVLVDRAALDGSGLLAPGTLFSVKYRLDLPPGADLAALEAEARARLADSGLRWRDARNGAPGIAEFVDRLGAFLVLVGLSGLAVGGVGVAAAVRAYLARKTAVIATLRSLGADSATLLWTYGLQIGAISALGIVLGLALGAGVPLLLAPVIEARLPVPADFALRPGPLAEAALYGALAAAIFTLWPLARAEDVRAATLFRDALGRARLLPAPRYLVVLAVLVALLLGAAAWLSGSARLTLWTAAGIVAALLALALAGAGLRHLARAAGRRTRGRPALRWALAALGGPGEGAAAALISLGLGLAVLSAIGQIDGNLRRAIAADLPKVAPSFFLVDIQQDQMPRLREALSGMEGVSDLEAAPMLRGILARINDRPAEEVAGDHWVVRGDRGVTYAGALPEGWTITEGRWWGPDYDGPPLVSFAAEEAQEIGLKLGDRLTVNILGRPITAEVANFRVVDFSDAGMGFVMAMNPGALAGAPHSFIATLYSSTEAEAQVLRLLSDDFPNVTAVQVREAIQQVASLLDGIAAAISWGASATLLTGLLVLIGAAAAGVEARAFEAAVLKSLGAGRGRILASFALRAALIGAAAGLVALLAGVAGAWAVSRFVMDTQFTVIWPLALGIVAGGAAASLLAGLAYARPALAARPAGVLRARE